MMGAPFLVGVTFFRSPAVSFSKASSSTLLEAWHEGEFAFSQTVLIAAPTNRDRQPILATAFKRAMAADLGRSIPSHPPAAGDLALVEGDLYVIRERGFEVLRRDVFGNRQAVRRCGTRVREGLETGLAS